MLTASDDLLLHECLRQCTRAKLDICCFQEFRRLGNDSISIDVAADDQKAEWNVWWSGMKRKRSYGVAIAIRKQRHLTIEDIGHVSSRVMWIDCICHGMKLRIVCTYAPTEEGSSYQKDTFYKELSEVSVVEKKRQLIVCGDMNATAEYCTSFVGGSNCTHTGANDNGERFANFLSSKELALSNTWFQHKKIHKDTWYSNTGNFAKTIDYICLSKWLNQYSTDCRVRRSFVFNNSDHRLLLCQFKTPRRKCDRIKFVKKQSKAKKYDVGSLKDEYVKSNFIDKVDELCAMINDDNTQVFDCIKLVNILEDAATTTLHDKVASKQSKIWDEDPELSILRNLRDRTDRLSQANEFKNITKQIQKRADQLRNLHYKRQADQLDDAYEARNLEKLFRLCKQSSSNKKPVEQTCPGLREHFEAHFTHQAPSVQPPEEIRNPPEFINRLRACGLFTEEAIEEMQNRVTIKIPDKAEIIRTIRKLKGRKAATDIPPEFLKAASESEAYCDALESLFKKVWELMLPDMWRMTTITALFKNKGKRKNAKTTGDLA